MPAPEAQLAIRAVRPLVSSLEALGHDPGPWLREVGIKADTLQDADARVPWSAVLALIEQAVQKTQDTNLGLHLAEHVDLGSLDVHFYAMVSSPTLGEAYQRLCRYQRLIHDTTRVELELGQESAMLRHVMPGGIAAPRQSAEFLLAIWVRGGRVATGVDWAPEAVHFAHQGPTDTRDHERFYRAPVRFATGENALKLPLALLQRPCVKAEPALLAVLDRYASDRLGTVPQTASVADRARHALREELRGGTPSAARLAASLKMSVRTLHRNLAAEHVSYRTLLDQERHTLACRHLADAHLSIAEIAFLLGFSELSAFYRAFRRWTGQTPADFRNQHLTDHA